MRTLILILILSVVPAGMARAQIPDEYQNLKVLPGDIQKPELMKLMKGFTTSLGVRCSSCHEEKTPGDFSSTDWASDKMKNKEIARGMMQMVQEINGNLLPAATGEHDFKVSCVTCHRGVKHPYTLDQLLLTTADEDGVEAATTKYRDLRDNYYGSGSYDFSPETLLTVATVLAEDRQDLDGARQLALLNLEMSPNHADSYLMLAQLDLTAGNTDAARASINKALELDPHNRHARRMLQQLEK